MSSFPFDTQACRILLVFAEYEVNEVCWQSKAAWVMDDLSERDVSAAWVRGENHTRVSTYVVVKSIGGKISNHSKSLFNFTILLTRNPKPAIIYIILPTVLITLFNIISAWLPTGQGNFVLFSHFQYNGMWVIVMVGFVKFSILKNLITI